ncbi:MULTISPECIES: DUF4342 domain-containing protein [Clostridium]|uniref:UBA/TS-N domain protein n=1 Tax=Clostridium botulinum (strain Eklund 17B / Type B) TaxID=935198 RepID=B2TMC1_CLOBB|nr:MULTISPECIES: DUF4342 domain-containing protein [Clostridium]ACD24393.1 UBA/TS-N domain protein [Clostridium botulinum B str. Eklund 17B (NRP)]MBN1037873.1 DUF4342 domain-containing protein [Clostridium botulinum]MBN1044576.1 DUF4342 domain-containing protein [Clostridium botulinum]MBN1051241.1 DUF4342 domain-containing protein [Clostridium botulinum]MBN1054532.1 DUF4342 domain-containing protein [Clostridium botulinum]
MTNITLEKVDMIIERTGVSYAIAKQALEECNGDVLEALIYLEEEIKNEENIDYNIYDDKEDKENMTIEELKNFIKDLIHKGNITRIKIKKEDTELIDIPVNAGIAAGVIAVLIPPILVAGVIAAVATKITIEITKKDGSVEVINKYVYKVSNDVKDKAVDIADKMKSKVDEVKNKVRTNNGEDKSKVYTGNETVYTYKVDFDDQD